MHQVVTETYKGWVIRIKHESKMCSSFSFYISDPSGYEQHVSMGGDNEKRAFERAREMIDMEIELAQE